MLWLLSFAFGGPLDDALQERQTANSDATEQALAATSPPDALPFPLSDTDRVRLVARWALLDASGESRRCEISAEQIDALIRAGMAIPSRRTFATSGRVGDHDEREATAWLAARDVKGVDVDVAHALPNGLSDVLWDLSTCYEAYERIPALRQALITSGLGHDPLFRWSEGGITSLDALELEDLRLSGLETPVARQADLERRMVALLRKYPDDEPIAQAAERLRATLELVLTETASCGGLCVRAREIVSGTRDPSQADRLERAGHCAPLVEAAAAVEVPSRLVDFRDSSAAAAAYLVRGGGCVRLEEEPGFPDLDAVKAHVGSCVEVAGEDWATWLEASRRAAMSGCAAPPQWALGG